MAGVSHGSEDFARLDNGMVLLTSGLRTPLCKQADRKGRVFLFDFAKPTTAREVNIDWRGQKDKFEKWNPHGMDAIKTGSSEYIVFVVNHAPHEAVERFHFDVTSLTLTHLESVTSDAMHLMNSVVAVNERSFFFSNSNYFRSWNFLLNLESFIDVGSGSIGSYNGSSRVATIVHRGLSLVNGLALSPNKNKLYVMAIARKTVLTFAVHSMTNITIENKFFLETIGDNIQVDADDNSLWIGAHPVPIKMLSHLKDPTRVSPSQVLNIKVDGKGHPRSNAITEVFMDDGELISASAVALRHKKGLLIGSVAHKLVFCQLECF